MPVQPSGRGAAWTARTVRVREVAGSNPAAPTKRQVLPSGSRPVFFACPITIDITLACRSIFFRFVPQCI